MSLTVDSITKYYGEQKVLDEISFNVEPGCVTGFLGPNGAGKTTTMKILVGLVPPSSGTAQVAGMDVVAQSLEIRRIVGYLPEHNPLYLDMYVREYLQMVAKVYKLSDATKHVNEVIEQTGLGPESRKKIGQLSRGYRQRVGLAQALVHNPKVVILDEPTTGLDPNQIIEIRNLIQDVGKNRTLLLSTHIMQEVEAICDKVIVINRGRIVANESVEAMRFHTTSAQQTVFVELQVEPPTGFFTCFPWVSSATKTGPATYMIESNFEEDIRPLLFKAAVEHNLTFLTLQKQEKHMEDVFRQLTLQENSITNN